jgi:hypothetical protein
MQPDYEALIAELTRPGAKKFATARQLARVSEDEPAQLSSHFAAFCRLLEDENNIIKWSAIRIVANLAAADRKLRVDRILDRYLAPIAGPTLITAANTIEGAARIAQSRRHLAPRIIQAILQVEGGQYQTPECRNVAIGKAIKALDLLGPVVRQDPAVLAFIKRQQDNSRPGVRRSAAAFLKQANKT